MSETTTFSGMPGVKAKKLEGLLVTSVSGFMRNLGRYRMVSAAGDGGSCSVYIDDTGAYRCAFHRYRRKMSEETVKTKRAVEGWLNCWLHNIDEHHS